MFIAGPNVMSMLWEWFSRAVRRPFIWSHVVIPPVERGRGRVCSFFSFFFLSNPIARCLSFVLLIARGRFHTKNAPSFMDSMEKIRAWFIRCCICQRNPSICRRNSLHLSKKCMASLDETPVSQKRLYTSRGNSPLLQTKPHHQGRTSLSGTGKQRWFNVYCCSPYNRPSAFVVLPSNALKPFTNVLFVWLKK